MDREATTMSVRGMRELLGIKKTDSYWLLKKNCFEVVKIAGKMRIVKKSFENWYAGQTHYRKVSGEEPGKQLETEFYSAQKISEMLGIKTCSVYDLMRSTKKCMEKSFAPGGSIAASARPSLLKPLVFPRI